MSKFVSRTRREFEQKLIEIKKNNPECGWWDNVTEKINKESEYEIKEYIYKMNTRHKKVRIIIFSTIDTEEDEFRQYGSDAIRLVYEWDTKNGLIYKSIRKRILRVEGLFENLEEELVKASANTQKLGSNGWINYKKFSSKYLGN